MSKSKGDNGNPKEFERQLAILVAKKEAIFARINHLYQLSLKLTYSDTRSNENFMLESETVDDLRVKFEHIIDEINNLNLTHIQSAVPDYGPLLAMEELYTRIKRSRNNIDAPTRSVPSRHETYIKLPPIDIPTFDGSTDRWPIFYESFKTNVHNNSQLSDSQRVQYLIGKLTNDALLITAGIIPTGETYNIIWESLVKKYQDKRCLGTHYLNNILDAKFCTSTASSLEDFIQRYSASVSALKQLNISDLTDFILMHCALRKIDTQTAQAFELTVRNTEVPSTSDLISFIQDQVKILMRSNSVYNSSNVRSNARASNKPLQAQAAARSLNRSSANNYESFVSNVNNNIMSPCLYCRKSDHKIYNCSNFKQLGSSQDRFNFIKSKNGCVNCLNVSHTLSSCKSTSVCRFCSKRHNTLLHFDKKCTSSSQSHTAQVSAPESFHTEAADSNSSRTAFVNRCATVNLAPSTEHDNTALDSSSHSVSLSVKLKPQSAILLSTAQVYAYSSNNNNGKKIIRCLIDSGSQNNLITVDCCKLLNLHIISLTNSYVKGVGLSSRPIHGYVDVEIQSRVDPKLKYRIQALVVDCITDKLPSQFIENCDMRYLDNLPLADLTWNIPGNVDLVLGAQLFPYIYLGEKVDSGSKAPTAISTAFGYVLLGGGQNITTSTSFTALALDEVLHKFWELEELPLKRHLSPEDTVCENIYTTSVTRDVEGRYCVALPFSNDPNELGNSRTVAQRRLLALERKFKQDPVLQENYNKVIQEYIFSGYLTEVPASEVPDEGYYIPHHAVVRSDKPLPRIVLDASARTHTGLSLNDVLHTGPNLQANLFLLLIDFRLFPIAITADIKQMYLQIGVIDDHCKYLKILYRFQNNESIRVFKFNRVPFGLKSSPYLAMRTVRQLATDFKGNFPEAAIVAGSNMYMDDLVYSISDEETASRVTEELILLFKSGSFDLLKWTSNSQSLLNKLPDSHRSAIEFSETQCDVSKVLGLSWDPVNDCFYFKTTQVREKCTKRNILSIVARLFDVLGLVAPIILYAKLLIKELWLCKIDWDDLAPVNVTQRFFCLVQELPLISDIKIPRHIGANNNRIVNIVAFCDASLNAYGCAIYLQTIDQADITVRLLCAKSKVSPTKIQTIARLELCAAHLLSNMIKSVCDTYRSRIRIDNVYAFSDSMIALSWIRSSPHRWSVFVSNRVAQIQDNVSPDSFHYVNGDENPSDCLSRGLLPSQLIHHDLWWHGPTWLQLPPSEWPSRQFSSLGCEDLPEHKLNVFTAALVQSKSPVLYEVAQRASSWSKLLNIIIYVLRFMKRVPHNGGISNLIIAEKMLLRTMQSIHFAEDIALLKNNKSPSKKLRKLSVFIDEENIVRIGGRLSNSDLPFEVKHPILLPKRDHIINLIIKHYHVKNCHAGPGLLMSILRQFFWILDARTVVRSICRKCNACFRVNPVHLTPKMADLPSFRVQEAKAFVHTGVDYAGPIRIILTRRRGQHAQKAYICLFICLVTKAVHIELVSDLSSDTYLAAFKRFISRRGPVSCLYSDNGTNFIGAKAQLEEYNSLLRAELVSRRIEWKLIPPRAPHFGGMWESNIKSLKTHLYRVIGSQLLTYEELQTVLIQIECVMNSRPLTVISSDPHPEVITPAHFLMSTPLQYLPAADLSDSRLNLIQRKKLLDNMVLSYWKKWRLEYLHTLQVRQKWATTVNPVKIGTIVLLHQDDSLPLNWPLGVIIDVFPGADGIIRVAMVKTSYGVFKRPVVKLYPVPTQ